MCTRDDYSHYTNHLPLGVVVVVVRESILLVHMALHIRCVNSPTITSVAGLIHTVSGVTCSHGMLRCGMLRYHNPSYHEPAGTSTLTHHPVGMLGVVVNRTTTTSSARDDSVEWMTTGNRGYP